MELLLISNADFHTSAGDITLMVRRARAMAHHGVQTTFFTIVNNSCQEEYESYRDLKIVNSDPDNRLASICEYIKTSKPAIICLFGNRTLLMLNKINRFVKTQAGYHPKFYIDMQSPLEEEIEYKHGLAWIKRLPSYIVIRKLYSRALSRVDGVFTVSDELHDYCMKLSSNPKLENIKIRCGLEEVLSTEEKLSHRSAMRAQWGINDSTVVMCFSGYRKPWQKIDQIMELFSRIDKDYDDLFFAFFCDNDPYFKGTLKSKFPQNNYMVKFLSQEEYFAHLCGCDIGFIMRDDNMTNRLAFPNKFSDYLNAGLLCCLSESLQEPNRVLKMANIPFIGESEDLAKLMEIAHRRQSNLQAYYSASEQACNEYLLFSSQYKIQKVEWLAGKGV